MANDERITASTPVRLPLALVEQAKQAARILAVHRQEDTFIYTVLTEAFDEWVERHPELFPETSEVKV